MASNGEPVSNRDPFHARASLMPIVESRGLFAFGRADLLAVDVTRDAELDSRFAVAEQRS